jgi:ribosomal protein S18 acetylase RimI-like enzyme
MTNFEPSKPKSSDISPILAVTIRAMEMGDLDAVIEFGTSTAEFDTSTDSPQFYSRATLEKWISSPNGVLLVAQSGPEVVGFRLAAYNPDSRDGYLHTIAVKQAYRNQGIGTQLMAETLRRLEAMGCNHVVALVQEGNDSTLGFLRKNGFGIGGKFHYCDVSLPQDKR